MATIADVARAAGVSISTVSYVMSGKRTISQQTRDRVARAIDDLDFRPHAGARSLASRTTNVIGLQAPLRSGVDVHVVMQIVAGVVKEARAHTYDILLLTSDDGDGLERAARASMVDGLLLMDVESHDPRLSTLRGIDIPSVLIGLPDGAAPLTCVDFDFDAAGRLAAERLVALGHRRLALFGAPEEVLHQRHTSYADRLVHGFLAASDELGVVGSVHATPTTPDAIAAIVDRVTADESVTGFFVHNEEALPVIAARLRALEAERAAEWDVVALAPAELTRNITGLTNRIDIPAEEIGANAARILRDLVAGEATPQVHLLPPRLHDPTTAPS